jgi:cell division protein FtsB
MSMRIFVLVGIVLVVALQYRYWFGDAGYFEVKALTAKIEKQTRVNDRLAQRNRVLAAEVDALRDGLDAVESRARTDLGMITDGETFYVVVSANPKTERAPPFGERTESD